MSETEFELTPAPGGPWLPTPTPCPECHAPESTVEVRRVEPTGSWEFRCTAPDCGATGSAHPSPATAAAAAAAQDGSQPSGG